MLEKYFNEECYTLPERNFVYTPQAPNSFSYQGEDMVSNLLKIAPLFKRRFDQLFPIELQKEIHKEKFEELKLLYNKEIAEQSVLRAVTKYMDEDGKVNKKYFETKRTFETLVPASYKRTEAPRISTKGNTFHAMKKSLLIEIVKELSIRSSAVFIDVDMSAAHTRIGRFLLSDEDSDLNKALSDAEFWPSVVSKYKDRFAQVLVNEKQVKKILKVGLYTSMNGGNPVGDKRLIANITSNLIDTLDELNIRTPEALMSSSLFKITREVLDDFALIKDVQAISSKCFYKEWDVEESKANYFSYTIDKVGPYEFDKGHKGISRVLQGFEVVLLTVLVYKALKLSFTPVSLDHDGCLLMLTKGQFELYNNDPFTLSKAVESGKFESFCTYLLKETIPIEPKRLFIGGKIFEY